jgi:hypothetical protein
MELDGDLEQLQGDQRSAGLTLIEIDELCIIGKEGKKWIFNNSYEIIISIS